MRVLVGAREWRRLGHCCQSTTRACSRACSLQVNTLCCDSVQVQYHRAVTVSQMADDADIRAARDALDVRGTAFGRSFYGEPDISACL